MEHHKSRWILWIYAGGFFLGASAHAYDILRRGFLPYKGAPFPMNIYWTSLLVLDLLVVGFTYARPRIAALLAVALMVSDIVVDCYAVSALDHQRIVTNFRLDGILLFGVFVFVTAPLIWKHSATPTTQRL